jgi:phosphatidylserine/phosphatidylglycerophosphate/cardiolipin synthase-like enzyme
VELVWNGPGTEGHPFRRTEQAVLQVLDSARERITLVSYSVYWIPRVCAALVRAAGRGVRISVILAACSAVYYWPRENRRQDDRGGSWAYCTSLRRGQ